MVDTIIRCKLLIVCFVEVLLLLLIALYDRGILLLFYIESGIPGLEVSLYNPRRANSRLLIPLLSRTPSLSEDSTTRMVESKVVSIVLVLLSTSS